MRPPVEEFYSELGRRIQEMRTRRRLTQAELGAKLHPPVTRASIANIENGKQRVLGHTLVDVATALRVRLDELVPATRSVVAPAVAAAIESELASKLTVPADLRATIVEKLRFGGNT